MTQFYKTNKESALINDVSDEYKKLQVNPNEIYTQVVSPDISKKYLSMDEVERSFIEKIVEDIFSVAKKLEMNSSTISDMVLYLVTEKRVKYSNKKRISKLKSDILDKEAEIKIIQSGYYK